MTATPDKRRTATKRPAAPKPTEEGLAAFERALDRAETTAEVEATSLLRRAEAMRAFTEALRAQTDELNRSHAEARRRAAETLTPVLPALPALPDGVRVPDDMGAMLGVFRETDPPEERTARERLH